MFQMLPKLSVAGGLSYGVTFLNFFLFNFFRTFKDFFNLKISTALLYVTDVECVESLRSTLSRHFHDVCTATGGFIRPGHDGGSDQ